MCICEHVGRFLIIVPLLLLVGNDNNLLEYKTASMEMLSN